MRIFQTLSEPLTLVIENISPALYSKLEDEARQHHRSITQQIVALLEQSLSKTQPSIPPTPIDLGVRHDSEWVYAATREGRFAGRGL